MKRTFAVIVAVLLGLALSGCAALPSLSGNPAMPAVPNLTGEAVAALAQADAAAHAAKAAFTLWVPAQEALNLAHKAALAGDSLAVIAHANRVFELCRLSAIQAAQPVPYAP